MTERIKSALELHQGKTHELKLTEIALNRMIAESLAYHCLEIEMIDLKTLKNSFTIARSLLQHLIRREISQILGKPLKLLKVLKSHGV